MVAEHLIDEAAFGDHPLGRTVLGPEEHLRTFTREGIVAFRERRWAGERGGAFIVGNLEHVDRRRRRRRAARRASPTLPAPRALRPGAAARDRRSSSSSATPTSRTCGWSTARRSTSADRAPARGADDLLDAARRLDGLAAVRRDPRAARPLLLGLRRRPRVRRRRRCCSSARGWSRRKCVEAYARMREIVAELRRRRADRGGGRARPRLRRRPPRAGLREHERGGPLRGRPAIVFGEPIDPDEAIAALDARHLRRGRRGRPRRVDPDELAVACVGPHTPDEF